MKSFRSDMIAPSRWPMFLLAGAIITIIFIAMGPHMLNVLDSTSTDSFATQASQRTPHLTVAHPNAKYAAESLKGLDSNSGFKVISSKYFDDLINEALNKPRKRKMVDLTKNPKTNKLQTLMNTWTEGSYSPVHKHSDYSETFCILSGALALFEFTDDGQPTCHVLSSEDVDPIVIDTNNNKLRFHTKSSDKVIVVETNTWHALAAAPKALGWPGYAVVFESSGHVYDPNAPVKILAPFAPVGPDGGVDGDKEYFEKILALCPRRN